MKTEGLTPREKKKHGNVVSSGSLELFSIDLIFCKCVVGGGVSRSLLDTYYTFL